MMDISSRRRYKEGLMTKKVTWTAYCIQTPNRKVWKYPVCATKNDCWNRCLMSVVCRIGGDLLRSYNDWEEEHNSLIKKVQKLGWKVVPVKIQKA